MTNNPKINAIIKNIENLEKKDFKVLYLKGPNVGHWPNYNNEEIEFLVNDTLRILRKLKQSPELLVGLVHPYFHNIENYIATFISTITPIINLDANSLTTHHHAPLNQLQALNTTLRQSGLYSILSPSVDIPKLEKDLKDLKDDAAIVVKEAQDNAGIIRSLIPEATATSLSVALNEIAVKLQKRVNTWLSVVIIVLLSSAVISWMFLESNDKKENQDISEIINKLKNVSQLKNKTDSLSYFMLINTSNVKERKLESHDTNSISFWLKRIIIFLPLFYLIFFCIKQYNKERKLLEIYVHKKAISQTLPAYMKQAEKAEVKDEILLRGATMIFTLPEDPNSTIHGSDGMGLTEVKDLLDIKDKIQKQA
jgi:hypothetical protein